MIALIASQLLAIAGIIVLLGLPGWLAARLLQLQLSLPAVLLPPAVFALGLGLWTMPVLACLSAGWSIDVMLAMHGAVTLVLLGAWVWKTRVRGLVQAKASGIEPVGWWTIGGIAACTALAAALRSRLAFDTLFHIGLVRRIAELPSPTFDGLDRIAGVGVNPAYVVPTWQAALAGVSRLTGLDPAVVVESMAGVIVLLGACAAAGFGRLLSGRAAGEVAAIGAFAWMRVWYPRREAEGDGIGFAVHPGNIGLDVLLPLVLAAALVVLLRPRGAIGRRTAALIVAVATVMYVLLHANYVVYLALIGGGLVLWLLLAGPWNRDIGTRVLDAAASIAVPGAVTLGALLPVLATLDHFAEDVNQRLDYHLIGSGMWQIVRPGHYYDAFGVAGLLAMLLLPVAVLHLTGVRRALLGGGSLMVLAVGLVPQLFELLSSAGSLTVGMRLPRPMGVLLIGVVAVALPVLVEHVRTRAERATSRGMRLLVRGAPLVALTAVAAVYGYPLIRQVPAEYGWNWPTIAAAVALLAVLVWSMRHRGSVEGAAPELVADVRAPSRRTLVSVTGIAVLLVTVAFAPSGFYSLRRATWQSREFVPSVRADDLGCLAGVQQAVRDLPADTLVLADPVTGYVAQALGPVRIFGDFKTWNGSTNSELALRRVNQLERIYTGEDDHRVADLVNELRQTSSTTYLLVADGVVEPPLDSDLPTFSGRGLRMALKAQIPATRIAYGRGTDTADDACSVALWRFDR